MSWYNNILTNASTNITKLQRTYFAGDADGDTEDDTHVCRVLRSYYTEKGQAFPGWLPPDPKAPPPVQPVYAQQNQVGSRYGGLSNPQHGGGAAPAAGSGRLQSLWDNNSSQQPAQPASLRQGRANPFAPRGGREEAVQSRPLPSQRGGSYQQTGAAYGRNETTTPPGPTTTGGGSAQDKLKQRLWGGSKTTSPAGSGGPFQPPSQPQQPQGGSRRGGSGSGGGGGGNYEDRFAPPGAYDRGSDKPVMSANAPWAGGDMDYYSGGPDLSSGSGSGGGGGSSGRNRPAGLPSGPRRGGLPSGPRMR
ncbi:Sec1-binding region of Mso1-domain-containing protein [Schizothecium vesticola]|uniref:Sec1-binding region of Mso1-domain-containing protein n=1 Tax=Schizothecium vesticola TaxID=314040 RepID=A0AA40FB30_9PEZI|nr:Sec1-binding region of Mso1-domain-containing protein [Schizothecium vesticola]